MGFVAQVLKRRGLDEITKFRAHLTLWKKKLHRVLCLVQNGVSYRTDG